MRQTLLFAVFLAVPAAADSGAQSSASAAAFMIAPTEYDWTFFYHGSRYGLQQYGPVAIYHRNTVFIWHNMAHRSPVTVPWVLVITACIVIAPFGLIALRKER
jgi:hypothetical protein